MSEKDNQPVAEQELQMEEEVQETSSERVAESVSEQAEETATEQAAEAASETGQEAESGQEHTYADGQDGQEAADKAASEQSELERLRQEMAELHERYLRAQADFDNFRKRTRQEKEEFAKYASAKLIENLLPVLDNFERAIASAQQSKDVDALLKGIEMISRQLDQVLAQEGLQRMETIGKPFDPNFHQAVGQVETDEYEEGVVVEELQKGYQFKDKVLRPAMVKVSK